MKSEWKAMKKGAKKPAKKAKKKASAKDRKRVLAAISSQLQQGPAGPMMGGLGFAAKK